MNIFKRIKRAYRSSKAKRQHRKFIRLQGFKHFRRECLEAERLAKENNKRYRVYLFDRYRALSREDIIRMKNYGVISKKQETGMYSKMVLYDTMTNANTHPDFSNRKIRSLCTFHHKK